MDRSCFSSTGKDLLRIDKPDLRAATAQVISLLVRLARFEGPSEYELVTRAAFEWGFDKSYGPNWNGDEDIRDGLIDAAKAANESAHGVLSAAFLEFVGGKSLPDLPRWYSHDLRLLVMNLLANTNCMDSADGLAAAYDRINEASH